MIWTHDSGQLFAGWRTTMEFGYFWGWTVIGVKVGIYYEIGPQSPSLDSQGDRKATHGNVNWIFQVENRGSSLPRELFNKYDIKASHSLSQKIVNKFSIKDPAAHSPKILSAQCWLWGYTCTLLCLPCNKKVADLFEIFEIVKLLWQKDMGWVKNQKVSIGQLVSTCSWAVG